MFTNPRAIQLGEEVTQILDRCHIRLLHGWLPSPDTEVKIFRKKVVLICCHLKDLFLYQQEEF